MEANWYDVHCEALNVVHRDEGIKYFRKSKVPGSYLVPTTVEYEKCFGIHK